MKPKILIAFLSILACYFFPFTISENISGIGFSFCNDIQKDKIINVQAGETKELCLNFFSRNSEAINIQYGFSKAFIKSTNGLQLCDQDMSDTNDFSKLFYNDNPNNRTITIPQLGAVKVYEKIKPPLGTNGMIYGCLTFKTSIPENTNVGGMFNIIERKSVNLNLLIGGIGDIKSSIKPLDFEYKNKLPYISNKKLNLIQDGNKISILFNIKNDGDISQESKIQGKIYNVLGFEKKFHTQNYIIAPGTNIEISQEIGILPAYKGPFKINFEISSYPYIDFQSDNVDQSLKNQITIQGISQVFIFSWIWIFLAIIVMSIIIITFKPLFKRA